MSRLAVDWRSILIPKQGHTLAECEDAIAGDLAVARFAVADGASESVTSGEWAQILVQAFLEEAPDGEKFAPWLAKARAVWESEIVGRELSWYAEQKFQEGAFATFLGIEVWDGDDCLHWRAIAVGDSCLFVLRDECDPVSFPITHAEEFAGRPHLINSRRGQPVWQIDQGTLRLGDRILLATDALAHRILAGLDRNEGIDASLFTGDEWTVSTWVEAARAWGSLKNDDVALGVIEVCPAAEET